MRLLLEELIGTRVRIWSGAGPSEQSDEGVLEAFDGSCLRLKKTGGELLYFWSTASVW